MKLLSYFILNCFFVQPALVLSQDIPTPAPPQYEQVMVHSATIHIGNGQVIQKGVLRFENGKISEVSSMASAHLESFNGKIIDATGKHVYPGLIGLNTYLGLSEIEAVRASNDVVEQGVQNANVRSIVSYNTDSRVTPTVRSNGVLYAQIVPRGGMVSGTTSLVQLDAWNWEDAAVIPEEGVVLNWPTLYRKLGWWADAKGFEINKEYEIQRQEIIDYFREAKAYAVATNEKINLRFESLREVVQGRRKIYIQVQHVKEILHAIDFAEQLGMNMTLLGAADCHLIADLLAQKKISVILSRTHDLPNFADENIHQNFMTPAILKSAGVVFAISNEGFWQVRNLPFQAGQAVAFGLTKEEALQSITLNPALILGIDKKLGSLEIGKDASFIISEGDILDMKSSRISHAFIEGRAVDLSNKQTDLYHKYLKKYQIK